ncbi:AAA family ATPase [Kitasatospora sp. NPDC094015]|uniref:AAA family ATPase n=1 Tax=Kitasatospora sp. NPDC094015 TaxID=3155205 RepID=UPI00332DFEF3
MTHTHLVLGRAGSGKTRTLQQLITENAADPIVTTWAIEPARRNNLTAADRHTTTESAEQLLDQALDLLAQRRDACTATGRTAHTPTAAEPRVLLLIDEAEHLLRQARPVEQLHELVVTGRALAVETAVATSHLFLDVWPLDLRECYLAGDLTLCGRVERNWPVRARIAAGTATVHHRPAPAGH